MKKFEEPIVEVMCLEVQDIVTTSDQPGTPPPLMPPCG